MMPSARGGAAVLVIVMFTYLIAMGEFTHVIAGTVEVFLVVFAEGPSQLSLLLTFTGPAFVGNVVGGTFLFALLAYAQVRDEL